jgi:hypothetical protein
MDEYDYIDIAVDTLRNIKHFELQSKLHYCRSFWKAHLPCNIDTIDAVTTQEMGRKAYATRVDFEMDGILNTDTYYTMEGIMTSLGRGGRPGLAGAAGKGYISYQLEGKHISVV